MIENITQLQSENFLQYKMLLRKTCLYSEDPSDYKYPLRTPSRVQKTTPKIFSSTKGYFKRHFFAPKNFSAIKTTSNILLRKFSVVQNVISKYLFFLLHRPFSLYISTPNNIQIMKDFLVNVVLQF